MKEGDGWPSSRTVKLSSPLMSYRALGRPLTLSLLSCKSQVMSIVIKDFKDHCNKKECLSKRITSNPASCQDQQDLFQRTVAAPKNERKRSGDETQRLLSNSCSSCLSVLRVEMRGVWKLPGLPLERI